MVLSIFSFGGFNMKNKIFDGVATALVTPFKDGKIDLEALRELIEMQICAGVQALVLAGTTGECATLNDTERYELFEASSSIARGRIKLIFGTGTNDTEAMLRHSRAAEKYSPDGLLVVTPYYNKGTEDGIVKHYESLIKAVNLPIIIYNVPSRTGVNLSIDTLKRLALHEGVVGIKEAGDSVSRLVSLAALREDLPIYAGNDNQLLSVLALGGAGVISVVSNILPEGVVKIHELARGGNWDEALYHQTKMLGIIDAMFCETNPSPVKWLMHKRGLITDEIRLPLTVPSEKSQGIIFRKYMEYIS
jgi:4-hydroxy-tetrahydrodipicolinate synthase